MISLQKFEIIFKRELERIPWNFKRGVNGFFVDPRSIRQSGNLPGIFILGHYHTNNAYMGPTITLYYGSFRKVFRGAPEKVIRREIAKTLAHELLHHWEIQSGIDTLGDEDRRKLSHWKKRLGMPTGDPTGRDLLESLVFLAVVFAGIIFASLLFYRIP